MDVQNPVEISYRDKIVFQSLKIFFRFLNDTKSKGIYFFVFQDDIGRESYGFAGV